LDVAFEDMGEQHLKNIAVPVRAYRVRFGDQLTDSVRPALALPDKPSIAVLPFQNMSGDPEQDYFADGIVEDIITALSRFTELFVIARNSSFTYKGRAVDVKQVGRELGVRYVLEGSVRKAGNRLRITGQLIDAVTSAHIWADHFDGPQENVFDLQDEITMSVVGAIAPKLQQAEIERAKRKPRNSKPVSLDQRGERRSATVVQQGYRARSRIRLRVWHGSTMSGVASSEWMDFKGERAERSRAAGSAGCGIRLGGASRTNGRRIRARLF
jgi:adenylate cyclase